jgi:hypothetical protein
MQITQSARSLLLDFGHSGIDPLQTRQERAGAVLKIGKVWCEGRHHEITWPPMPLQLSPHLAAIFLLSGLEGMAKVESYRGAGGIKIRPRIHQARGGKDS